MHYHAALLVLAPQVLQAGPQTSVHGKLVVHHLHRLFFFPGWLLDTVYCNTQHCTVADCYQAAPSITGSLQGMHTEYSTMHYSPVEYSTVLCSTVLYRTVL